MLNKKNIVIQIESFKMRLFAGFHPPKYLLVFQTWIEFLFRQKIQKKIFTHVFMS